MNGRSELFRALGALSERPDGTHGELARSLGLGPAPTREEHTKVLGLSLYPYASVYLGPEGMLGGEARDRVAGSWRALGYVPPNEPDHVAALLGLYASMIEAEAGERDPARLVLRRQMRAALLWEHLASWLPPYLTKMSEGSGFYAAWAALLLEALVDEISREPTVAPLPLHLREAPGLGSIDEEENEFVGAMFAPVRSGIILTRGDLTRCARDLGLGGRLGERAFMLRALLGQDASAVAGWLSAYARTWGERHAALRPRFGIVMDHWKERADAAQTLLLGLQRAAEEVVAGGAGS